MSLQIQINDELKSAMKEKKEPDLSTLRMLKADIQYELTKTGSSEIPDDQILQIIKKNISKRKDTASAYKSANRIDLAEKEELEAKFLEKFVPPSLPEEEIKKVIDSVIETLGAKSPSDSGKVIGKVMGELKGKNVEGSVVANLVKSILNGK
ncbi:MAG: GatB/YqeY domain-containing protein [Leptospiraceae bacterium]|nr:GatB/YqeY domain-containing protein [Leptospiraceae bacterium]